MAAASHPTKADLASALVDHIHVPEPWADFRVRKLSEARVLPRRRELLTFTSLAGGIFGIFGSDTHDEAPERARRLFDLPLVVTRGAGTLLPRDLVGLNCGQVLTALLRIASRPNGLVELRGITLTTTHDEAEILLGGTSSADPASYTVEHYGFSTPGAPLGSHVFGVRRKVEVGGSLLRALATLGSDPEPLLSGASTRGRKKSPPTDNAVTLPGATASDLTDTSCKGGGNHTHTPQHSSAAVQLPEHEDRSGRVRDRSPNDEHHRLQPSSRYF